jgi:flavorubredoxin
VNEEPGGHKNFKQNYGVVFRKCDAVEDIIEHGIHGPAVTDANFETKFNGLCALRDIGISIMGAVPSSFAKETRYSQAPQKIGDAMEAIIEDMTQEEKVLVWQSEGWVGDMRELKKELASYGVDFGVDEIIEMCRPNAEDEVEQANSGRIRPAVIVLD